MNATGKDKGSENRIEAIARDLAAGRGERWDDLNEYPGYTRNYWRAEARRMLIHAEDRARQFMSDGDGSIAQAITRIGRLIAEGRVAADVACELDAIVAAVQRG